MKTTFNVRVRQMINQEGYSFESAVRELARRAVIVRHANRLARERKSLGLMAPTEHDRTWENIESPSPNLP